MWIGRSDGSVSARATIEDDTERIDLFYESTRGAEEGPSHAWAVMRDPRLMGAHAHVRRTMVRRGELGTLSLEEAGGRDVGWRDEGWVAADGSGHWTTQQRTSRTEYRSRTTRDTNGRVVVRWFDGADEIGRRVVEEQCDVRGRVTESRTETTRYENENENETQRMRERFRYDDEGRLREVIADGVNERGEPWSQRADLDDYFSSRPLPPVVIERDGAGRVIRVQGPWTLTATRDDEGRIRHEHAVRASEDRMLERTFDDEGRLRTSTVRVRAYDETHESLATYAYEGACEETTTPIVLGHEAEADTPFDLTSEH